MPKTEEEMLDDMCWLMEQTVHVRAQCKVLASALYSAKSTTKPWGVIPQRVFIQDLAASLNRRGILPNENVAKFEELGYEYMGI